MNALSICFGYILSLLLLTFTTSMYMCQSRSFPLYAGLGDVGSQGAIAQRQQCPVASVFLDTSSNAMCPVAVSM